MLNEKAADGKAIGSRGSSRTGSPVRQYVPLLKTVPSSCGDSENGNHVLHSTTQAINELASDNADAMVTQSDVKMSPDIDRPHSIQMDTITIISPSSIQSNTLDNASSAQCAAFNNQSVASPTRSGSSSYAFKSQSVASPTRSNQSAEDIDYLSELPLEVVRYLMRFLDGFSMCNLAMTSKLLRQVCCSMLEERGMVVLQWEKHRGHWQVAYKVSGRVCQGSIIRCYYMSC